jgi:hypothetical protein
MKRMLSLALGAALVAVALTGCAPGGGAREAAEAYLEALSSRDVAAAIALTTSPASDFACPDADTSIGGEKIGEVVENASTATAEVSYNVGENEISETLELVKGDDGWRVRLSDSHSVTVPVPENVVVAATLEEYLYDDACPIEPVDGEFRFLALPGTYSVALHDPSGIFSWVTTANVLVPADDTVDFSEPFPGPNDMEIAANLLEVDTGRAAFDCIASHFAGDTCPDDIPAGDQGQAVDRPFELISGTPRAVDIYSPDGETWHFTTDTQDFQIQVDGVLTSVPFSYSGVLALDDDGQLIAVFD